jgi:hypothetical protein
VYRCRWPRISVSQSIPSFSSPALWVNGCLSSFQRYCYSDAAEGLLPGVGGLRRVQSLGQPATYWVGRTVFICTQKHPFSPSLFFTVKIAKDARITLDIETAPIRMEIWYANYTPNPSPTTPNDAFHSANPPPPKISNQTTLENAQERRTRASRISSCFLHVPY